MKKVFTLLTLALLSIGSAWAEAITVTWLPDGSSSSVTSKAGTASVANILTITDLATSSDIKEGPISKDYSTGGKHYYGYFTPTTALGNKGQYSKDDYITFAVTVKDGYIFTPTSVSLYAIGIGTGNVGAGVFATVQTENGSGTIGKGDSSNQDPTELTLNSFSSTTYTAGETVYFYVHIGVKDANKSVGLRDVVLTGTYASASTDPTPAVITTQPSNTEANVGVETTLTVAASGYPAPTYQWYTCDDAEKTNATAIDGATSSSYSFTPAATGTYYYYVTATNENTATPVASNVVTVTVSAGTTADPTFTVYGNTVQLSCATADAVIYYELDNADVKTSDTKSIYSDAFIPASSGTIYVYAQKEGYNASAVVSKAVTLSTVGDVVGSLIAKVQAAKNATTTAFDHITVTSPASPTWDGRGAYVNHMKVSGTVTLAASDGATIKSIKIYGTSNDGSKAATITAGDGATVVSTPAELMPRDVTVGGVQTMTEIVITVDEPAVNNSVSFTLGRESRLYIEVYGTDNVSITPANDMSTYVTTKALDFSGVAGLKAYAATAASAGKVTLEEVSAVPAGTPLLLVGTAGTEYTVPVATTASAPAKNMFEAGDGTTTFDGSTYDYILYTDGLFYQIGSGSVAVGKAYLHCDSDPTAGGARGLTLVFGEGETTGVENIEHGTLNIEHSVYDLQGRRVAKPTKGLYIVNGRKVVIK